MTVTENNVELHIRMRNREG